MLPRHRTSGLRQRLANSLHSERLPPRLLNRRPSWMDIEFLLCAACWRFYAITSLSPSAMFIELAYSMCRTRLGASDCDFDDACTIRGRIAKTPPRGNRRPQFALKDRGVLRL